MLHRLSSGVGGFAWGAFFWKALGAVVLAVLLARWTWIWFAPRTPSVLPAAERASPDDAERLFGVSLATTDQATPLPNLALIGVFAGRNGFAILEVDGKRQIGVPIGGEISPGVKLLEAARDHVIISQGGTRQRVYLKGAEPKGDVPGN